MNVRTGTAVCLVLCLEAVFARPQVSISSASQDPAGVTEETSLAARAATTGGCNAELWDHVYHKTRLHIVHGCIAVTGTIRHIKREADGDKHIQLAVDPEFSKLLNERNKTAQGGTLIVEAICEAPSNQDAAEIACRDFHSPVTVPKAGSRVRVIGSYVLDKATGWMEIHPVSSIQVLR
jgi:hypothetical protein